MSETSVTTWFGDLGTKLVQTLMPALILGAILWAFSANEQLAVISTKLDSINATLEKMEDLPKRVDELKLNQVSLKESVKTCEEQTKENRTKIEMLEKAVIGMQAGY